MITQHLNQQNTRWVFTPNSSPDIWTGAGYRKANNNNNGIPFDNVKLSNNSQQFNPTPAGGTQTKKTTYDALPNSISPTSDWSNALTFTNKNNPQRNQLLLRSLLGTIPVLINKSGTGDEFTHTSDQKWDKTNEKDGNLPGFGEVNGGFIMFLSNLYLL
ncbi:adhesin [Mycoplasmoides genitalium]